MHIFYKCDFNPVFSGRSQPGTQRQVHGWGWCCFTHPSDWWTVVCSAIFLSSGPKWVVMPLDSALMDLMWNDLLRQGLEKRERNDCSLRMNHLSLRNNQLKLKISGKWLIILEDFTKCASNCQRKNWKMSTWSWLDLETLRSQLIMPWNLLEQWTGRTGWVWGFEAWRVVMLLF